MQRVKPLAEIDAWLHRDTMAKTLTVIGSFVSPYVRKVLACMNLKGLNYEVDPITPFYGNDEFERLSPLRRIPVLIDGDFTCPIPQSSVRTWMRPIAVIHCSPPTQRTARLLAGWRNIADTRLGDLFIWGLFYQKIVHPIVWGEPGDAERMERTLKLEIPAALDYLEQLAPGRRLPVRRHLRRRHRGRHLLPQCCLCRVRDGPRAGRGPPPSSIERLPTRLRRPAGIRGGPARRRDSGRRQALLDAGAPLTSETLGLREPRKGMMRL